MFIFILIKLLFKDETSFLWKTNTKTQIKNKPSGWSYAQQNKENKTTLFRLVPPRSGKQGGLGKWDSPPLSWNWRGLGKWDSSPLSGKQGDLGNWDSPPLSGKQGGLGKLDSPPSSQLLSLISAAKKVRPSSVIASSWGASWLLWPFVVEPSSTCPFPS